MGCVQQAVLDFDQEVLAPWRPRLVPVPDTAGAARSRRPHPSTRSSSRVGICAAPAPGTAAPRGTGAGRRAPRPSRAVRLRPTQRARRLAVVMALAAGVGLGSWLGPLLGGSGNELRLAGETSVEVRSGDTLWSIATSSAGEGDVRALVDEIQRLNGLDGADLVPGQVLRLP